MSHNEVYKWFEMYFPCYAGDKMSVWFPNGKNSIRVRQTNGQEFIFTHDGDKFLKFESIKSYLKSIEGGKS